MEETTCQIKFGGLTQLRGAAEHNVTRDDGRISKEIHYSLGGLRKWQQEQMQRGGYIQVNQF